MVENVMQLTTEAVKARLDLAGDPRIIERVLAAAIAEDLGAIRTAAVEAAKSNEPLRKLYEDRALSSEVLVELQAIWPACHQVRKRVRLC